MMHPVKLAMFLVVVVGLGWTANPALASQASPASGRGAAAAGPTAVPGSGAAPARIEGMIIGIARTATTTRLTIRTQQPNAAKRDIHVEVASETPISQGVVARNWKDLRVGSHVWLDCERRNGVLKADEIGILDPSVPLM
jgi:hypothetical protein